MREFSTTIREPFSKGLRPTEAITRKKDWFLDVRGGEVRGGSFHALNQPTAFEWPRGFLPPEFPYPQLLELRHYLILCDAVNIFLTHSHTIYQTSWEYQISAPAPRGTWTVADFGPWFVLCNGFDMFEFDLNKQKVVASNRFPRASCVFNHNNRLIFGGVLV